MGLQKTQPAVSFSKIVSPIERSSVMFENVLSKIESAEISIYP
jgi:hypothetical protein